MILINARDGEVCIKNGNSSKVEVSTGNSSVHVGSGMGDVEGSKVIANNSE